MTALATAELDDVIAADDTVPEAAVPAIIPGPTDMAVSLLTRNMAFGSHFLVSKMRNNGLKLLMNHD